MMEPFEKNTGAGRAQPQDVPEWAEITLTVENGTTANAAYACSENETLKMCAETLCAAVAGFPAADLLQISNNVIYYNLARDLKTDELHLASICVLAAKRAAADWMRKNGLPLPESDCCCC